jgi:hypothetical protein
MANALALDHLHPPFRGRQLVDDNVHRSSPEYRNRQLNASPGLTPAVELPYLPAAAHCVGTSPYAQMQPRLLASGFY